MSGEQHFTTELLLETTPMDFLQKSLESVGVRLLQPGRKLDCKYLSKQLFKSIPCLTYFLKQSEKNIDIRNNLVRLKVTVCSWLSWLLNGDNGDEPVV